MSKFENYTSEEIEEQLESGELEDSAKVNEEVKRNLIGGNPNSHSRLNRIFSKNTARRIRHTWLYRAYKVIKKIKRVVNEPSFYPEMERKPKKQRYMDNYKWLFKYHKYNPSYNRYGLDIKDFRNQDDYMDVRYVKADRIKPHHEDNAIAKHRSENITIRYSIMADNKHLFYAYIESMNPKLVPKTHVIIQGENVVAPLDISGRTTAEDVINALPDGKYIMKANMGAFGDSISVIERKGKETIVNKGEMTLRELIDTTVNEPYLIQDFIKQHPAISAINKSTVNTLRIISTRWHEETHILAAMIRLGVEGQIVDNASNGGTFVGVDIEAGKLKEYGFYYDKPRETAHPSSGLVYKDYEIPYWEESLALIKKLHPIIFGFATIGWDIAITEDGPQIVEINWNYSIKGIQICNGGLKPRWDMLKTM